MSSIFYINNIIDFGKLKVTRYKHNGRIYFPKIGSREDKLIIEQTKDLYKKIGQHVMLSQGKKPLNLTQDEYEGMICTPYPSEGQSDFSQRMS